MGAQLSTGAGAVGRAQQTKGLERPITDQAAYDAQMRRLLGLTD
jgi:hypothetical protein